MRKTYRLLAMLGSVVAALGPAVVASAQEYPSKPIEVVVGYPPGGGTE
jgi:tripartite-type tricarboxylate transporter receptor subunit TctC